MTLSDGAKVGPYQVLSLVGVGGMGEVYRARDTALNRDIALKVLPASLAGEPARLTLFRREAQVLASLNHPNIAHIHGIEQSGPVLALVMEFVEGPTLADRLAAGKLPLAEVLPIARQIAEALEAAHERGVVHRDLKPANIKVRPDGTIKVLDFGIAKALELPAGGEADPLNSPAYMATLTLPGALLGTAAFMSPEQARGKVVDRRTDIWAFGAVVYEMVTGARLFEGDGLSETLAAVLTRPVDWTKLPPDTPLALRRLLARCLERDLKMRLRDIGEARIEITRMAAAPDGPVIGMSPWAFAGMGSQPWRWAPWMVAGLSTTALVAVLMAWGPWRSVPPTGGGFALGISGTVTVRGSGAPLSGATVSIVDSADQRLTEATTNDAGGWTTTVGLPPGSYFVSFVAPGYVPLAYNNITCVSCSRTAATPIVLTTDAMVTGIDAALTPGGRLVGRITDGDGAGVQGVLVSLFETQSGEIVGSATSGANGEYAVADVPPGTVTARTSNAFGYIDELHPNTVCVSCNPTTGTPIPIQSGETTAGIDFVLDRLGRIAGRVSAKGGARLGGISVAILDPLNRQVATAVSNPNGDYITSGLPAGRYFVKTTDDARGYVNQLYRAKPCGTCVPNTGTPVTVTGTGTTAGIDFVLELGGTIEGVVRTAAGVPLANVSIHITDATAQQFSVATTSASGAYRITGVPPTEYWARANNSQGYLDRMYGDVDCMTCFAKTGTSITVRAGVATTGIDFTLEVGGSIAGTITDDSGAPLAGILARVHMVNGSVIVSGATDANGRYRTTRGLAAGTYYVTTFNLVGLMDEVYDNLSCTSCRTTEVTLGRPIVVGKGEAIGGIDFVLSKARATFDEVFRLLKFS